MVVGKVNRNWKSFIGPRHGRFDTCFQLDLLLVQDCLRCAATTTLNTVKTDIAHKRLLKNMPAILPNELVDEILDWVGCSDRNALHACSLVCRNWRTRSQGRLYSRIVVATDKHFHWLLRTFEDSPVLLTFVCSVCIRDSGSALRQDQLRSSLASLNFFPANCPRLNTLHLRYVQSKSVLTKSIDPRVFDSLRTLVLARMSFHNIAELSALASLPSNLASLTLKDVSFAGIGEDRNQSTQSLLRVLRIDIRHLTIRVARKTVEDKDDYKKLGVSLIKLLINTRSLSFAMARKRDSALLSQLLAELGPSLHFLNVDGHAYWDHNRDLADSSECHKSSLCPQDVTLLYSRDQSFL